MAADGQDQQGHEGHSQARREPGRRRPKGSGIRRGMLLGWRQVSRPIMAREVPDPHGLAGAIREGAPEDAPHRLGRDFAEPLIYDGDSHLLTIAPTGSGKGRGAIIPNLLTWPGPMIVVDPKGENYHVTARYRRSLGQRVHVLDPFNVVTTRGDSLNPFDVFGLFGSQIDADSEMLAELLAGGVPTLKDPFWDISASSLISGMIAYTAAHAAPEDRHFGGLRDLLWSDFIYRIARLLDTVPDLHPFVRAEFEGFLSISADVTRGGIIATAYTQAHVLKSDAVLRSLGPSTIDLDAVMRGDPMTIYLIIPPTKLDSHKSLLRLWIGTMLLALMQRKRRPDMPTVFLLDECAQLGSLGVLRQAVTLMRGYGLQIWMFFQDLSQIKRLYPHDWETMVNNSAVLQTFGLNSHLVAREMGDLIGGMPAEALRQVRRDQQVCIMPGEPAMVTRRPDYLNDPLFEGRYDPNPLFGNPYSDRSV